MNEKKKKLLRILFAAQLLLFAFFYLVGPNGIATMQSIRRETAALEQELTTLKNEVATLEKQIHEAQVDPFYKEKIAREQLQMARKNEIIYIRET